MDKDALEESVKSRDDRISKLETGVAALESRLTESETIHREEIEGWKEAFADEERKRKRVEEKLRAWKASVPRWVIFAVCLICTSLALWMHQSWVKWLWLTTHSNKTYIQLASQLLLVLGLLNVPLRRHWKTWLTLIVPIVVAILTLAAL